VGQFYVRRGRGGKQEVLSLKTVTKNKKRTLSGKKKLKGEPKLYEAMFLIDSAEATTDWDGVTAAIRNILEKWGAEIVSMKKWDDRRLAYEINGKSKGTYILCYFKAEGGKLRNIEKDFNLSERIMRVLILCAEQRQTEDTERDSVYQKAGEKRAQKDTTAAQAEEHEQKNSQTDQKEDGVAESEQGEQ